MPLTGCPYRIPTRWLVETKKLLASGIFHYRLKDKILDTIVWLPGSSRRKKNRNYPSSLKKPRTTGGGGGAPNLDDVTEDDEDEEGASTDDDEVFLDDSDEDDDMDEELRNLEISILSLRDGQVFCVC